MALFVAAIGDHFIMTGVAAAAVVRKDLVLHELIAVGREPQRLHQLLDVISCQGYPLDPLDPLEWYSPAGRSSLPLRTGRPLQIKDAG
ncbi:MAG: hypothetical protein M3Y22_01395 [Pseudomonadota bacterium]|nr:hypothetical protein [Pseudomonadota bacterium]